jgi:hypothetical protein
VTVTDRPFADEPTEVLRTALDLAIAHTWQAARFRPAKDGDALPAVVDLFRTELQQRSQTLPPPQGPEYTPCACSHIEPEHDINGRWCAMDDCECSLYRPAPAAPAGPAPATDRAALSAKLWQIAEHHIVAEWICCEPLNPKHDLCAKGYAALGMAKTLLVDSDPKEAWNPNAPLLDAILAMLPAPDRQTALERVRALHQPMERGPFTICAHCSGWDGKWRCLGVVTDYPCPTVRALDGEPAREAQQDPTQDGEARTPFIPPAHYRGRDGTVYCVHATPVGPDSCSECRDLADEGQPTAVARPGQPETDTTPPA